MLSMMSTVIRSQGRESWIAFTASSSSHTARCCEQRAQHACIPVLPRSNWWLHSEPSWNNSFQIFIHSLWDQKFCGGVEQINEIIKRNQSKESHVIEERVGGPLCGRAFGQRDLAVAPWLGIQEGIAWLQQKIWDVVCTVHLEKRYWNLLTMHWDLPLWIEEMCLVFYFGLPSTDISQRPKTGGPQIPPPVLFDSVWKTVLLGSHAYVGLPPLLTSSR